jgi:tryptophan synthase alpha chain
MGPAKFFSMARSCNVDGAIIPDIPLEEAADYRKAAVAHGLDTIFLAAPSTTEERLRNIVNCSSGFLYLVSHFGVTGAKDTIDKSTFNLIKRVLPLTSGKVPLAVGFGISKPEHVKNIIKAGANGAIVGSVFVNIIGTNQGNLAKMLVKLEETARMLKEATLP